MRSDSTKIVAQKENPTEKFKYTQVGVTLNEAAIGENRQCLTY